MSKIFQFHKGTIRTREYLITAIWVPSFQFHKGTIRTILPRILHLCLTYFNSIKVQLELTIDDALLAIPEFQFHKGTIRTYRSSRGLGKHTISIP